MTNYEKHKEEIIDMLVRENTCIIGGMNDAKGS